jgi:hypothetical protein
MHALEIFKDLFGYQEDFHFSKKRVSNLSPVRKDQTLEQRVHKDIFSSFCFDTARREFELRG